MFSIKMIQDFSWMGQILMVLAVPFLIFVAPKLLRYIIIGLGSYRRRSEKKTLHAQVIEYRKELSKISQVNEFAKYSKIQRKLRSASDQMNLIAREDLELNFKYILIAHALAWLIAIIFFLRLTVQLYESAMDYLGLNWA